MGRSPIIAGVLTGALLLAGCASGDDGTAGSAAEPARVDEQAAQEAAGDGAAEDAAAAGTGGEAGFTGAGSDISESVLRKRIRRAEVDLVVEDGAAAFADIRSLAQRSGGFVESADLAEPEEGARGTVVIRVPAEGLDDVLDELAALGLEEPATRISTEDVTEEFIDLDARLKNLRVLEAELQELLAEVREADDPEPAQLFTVFDRLRQIRDEIEQIEGRRQLLQDQVSLSKVTIHLEERTEAAAVPGDPWRPGEVVAGATAALLTAARAVANVAIWVGIVVIPVGLMLVLPVLAAVGIRRWWQGRQPTPST